MVHHQFSNMISKDVVAKNVLNRQMKDKVVIYTIETDIFTATWLFKKIVFRSIGVLT